MHASQEQVEQLPGQWHKQACQIHMSDRLVMSIIVLLHQLQCAACIPILPMSDYRCLHRLFSCADSS